MVFSWWRILQNWCTLRFSDDRGNRSQDCCRHRVCFHSHAHEVKNCRHKKVNASCFLAHPTWLSTGWSLLQQLAPFDRDDLLPTPSRIFVGCLKFELRYDTAFALQNRILALVQNGDEQLFAFRATSLWTPHSGRAFLLSDAPALRFPKSDRDFLGG